MTRQIVISFVLLILIQIFLPAASQQQEADIMKKRIDELNQKIAKLERAERQLKQMYWAAEDQFLEYRSLLEKLSSSSAAPKTPKVSDVARHRDLHFKDFFSTYEKARIPVVIENYWNQIGTTQTWDVDFLIKKCGLKQLLPVHYSPKEQYFGNMKSSSEPMTIRDYFEQRWNTPALDDLSKYSHIVDFPLPSTCSTPLKYFKVPKYFVWDNLRKFPKQLNYISVPYTLSSPAISAGPAGSRIGFRENPTRLHGYAIQLVGEATYRFLDVRKSGLVENNGSLPWETLRRNSKVLLYEDRSNECFSVDSFVDKNNNNQEQEYPLFKFASFLEAKVKPGDIIFLPEGTPYQVQYNTGSVSIQGYYISASNHKEAFESTTKYAAAGKPEFEILYGALSRIITPERVLDDPTDLQWNDYSNQVEGNWDTSGVQTAAQQQQQQQQAQKTDL